MIDLSGIERIVAGQGPPERNAEGVWRALRQLLGLRGALGPRLQVQTRATTVWRDEPLNEFRAWLTPPDSDHRAEVSMKWRGGGRLPHPSGRFVEGSPKIELFPRGDHAARDTLHLLQPEGIAIACSLARILWATAPRGESKVPSGRTGALRWSVSWELGVPVEVLVGLLDTAREVVAVEAVEDRFGFDRNWFRVEHGSLSGWWRAYCIQPCFNGEEITDPQPGRAALLHRRWRPLIAEFVADDGVLAWDGTWFASVEDLNAVAALRRPGSWKLR
jgi:hypothetical protein